MKWPFMAYHTPISVMVQLHSVDSTEGMSVSSMLVRVNRTVWVLTLA